MRFSREARRGFGRASVSLLAITMMTFGPIAAARAETSIDALMGASAEKVSNKELSEQRGGFVVNGMMFNIAVEQRQTVNGQLEVFSRLVANQNGWQQVAYHNPAAGPAGVAAGQGHPTAPGTGSTANGLNVAPQAPSSGAPLPTLAPPVASIADPSLGATSGGLNGGAVQSTGSGGTNAGAAILGGVELVVDAVTPPGLPNVTSAVANSVPGALGGTAPQAPQAPTIPGGSPGAIPGTDLANISGTGTPEPTTAGNATYSGSTNGSTVTAAASDTSSVPQSLGTSVMPASPGPQNVQILGGNQPLTNETVRRLLFGPSVVVNDKNNVVIQQYTSITVDISNFSSITGDAIRGQLAASIADLIRTQTANSLSGF